MEYGVTAFIPQIPISTLLIVERVALGSAAALGETSFLTFLHYMQSHCPNPNPLFHSFQSELQPLLQSFLSVRWVDGLDETLHFRLFLFLLFCT